MVYLAGDSGDLESSMRGEFNELTDVGSTDAVNIVVQWDRLGAPHPCEPDKDLDDPIWSETLRFKVMKDMHATRRTAYRNLCETNMSDGRTLADFVQDSEERFPARRYALVISGHGFGYLNQFQAFTAAGFSRLKKSLPHTFSLRRDPDCIVPQASIIGGNPYRSGTPDSSSPDDVLYNRELADSLRSVLRTPLDVLVFDECNMGMIETAYAVRRVTSVMVASEELVPGRGIPMGTTLARLVRSPGIDGNELARLFVSDYQQMVHCSPSYTMSAFNTTRIDSLVDSVSRLGAAMRDSLPGQAGAILHARSPLAEYGTTVVVGGDGDNQAESTPSIAPGRIDLDRFCEKLIKEPSANTDLRARAGEVRQFLRAVRIANGPSPESAVTYGSNGLAIYFPLDGQGYCFDGTTSCGYERCNTNEVVEFVHDTAWTDFLHKYFATVWSAGETVDGRTPHPLPARCEDLAACAHEQPFTTSPNGCDR